LNLTKPSEDEFYDINVQNENMDIIDREIGGLKQPAYEVPTAMSDLHSGEMITVAFGKIAKAVSTLISHTTSKATNSVLGHVKLSDSTSSTSASTAGVAATPKAVKAAYDLANSNTEKIGTTDISGIGDGTVTGAIVNNKEAIEDVSQSLTNIPIFRCGRIRVSYESPQYLKANVVFDKEMPSYDYSVAIGIDSNVLDCTAIYYENRSVHGFGISIYKADANFTSVDGVNLSWIVAM
jgi:hypothetical protein